MKKDVKNHVLTIFTAISLMLFVVSGAVVFTLNFRQLYYFDVNYLDIPADCGMPADEILENYDALIDYNRVTFKQPLKFPTLPMSDAGRIHFEEVKRIFSFVTYLCLTTFFTSIALCFFQFRKKNFKGLRLAAILNIAFPTAVGLLVALNWEGFFIAFHKLFFRNDYWIFDAETDPVITILPSAFFMHCAILILGLIVTCSILFFTAYLLLNRKTIQEEKTA